MVKSDVKIIRANDIKHTVSGVKKSTPKNEKSMINIKIKTSDFKNLKNSQSKKNDNLVKTKQ